MFQSVSEEIRIAVFASGSGSNAGQLMTYFASHPKIKVGLIVTDNEFAGVIRRAADFGIPVKILSKEERKNGFFLSKFINYNCIQIIILAGYLRLIPIEVVHRFEGKILNIHPSLLPDFGGKGMYGLKVHQAVVAAGATQSGITIHWVDEVYDHGKYIFQKRIAINPEWTPEQLQSEVLKLEHYYYPRVVEAFCMNLPLDISE